MTTTRCSVPTALPCIIAAALALSVASLSASSEDGDLAILSFPVGLVVGEHQIDVDLGPSHTPAELLLDGRPTCSLGGEVDHCSVDLGPDPGIHLLELVRRDGAGHVVERTHRWINRPGLEAELSFRFAPREPAGVCSGQVVWLHPDKLRPSLLLIQHDGRSLRIGEDGRSFAYPCADPAVPNLLTASAIFPDGRRAEAVNLSGGFGGSEGVAMTSVPLVDRRAETVDCAGLDPIADPSFQSFDETGFEIVFVLDPSAGYRGILSSAGRRYHVNSSWRRADASLWDADRIWIVMPDSILSRLDAFNATTTKGYDSTSGKLNWLMNLFTVANTPTKGDVRIADAVAASGLVAAAGPRRRAIALILGSHAERDSSLFSPSQAQSYLEEIGVPLQVFRIGKAHDDGWPEGDRVLTMRDLANDLEALRRRVDQQCIAWFRGDIDANDVAAKLPEGITIAGRR